MAARDLVTLAHVQAWAPPTSSVDTASLGTCITAASMIFESMTGRRLSKTTHSDVRHSGSRTDDGILVLADPETGLRIGNILEITSIYEDGVSLPAVLMPTGTILATTKVLVDKGSGLAYRVDSSATKSTRTSWAPGTGNIKATLIYGFMADPGVTPGANDILTPYDVIQAVSEITWMIYREGWRAGVQSMSGAGASSQFSRDLSPFTLSVIESWTLDPRLRTLAP